MTKKIPVIMYHSVGQRIPGHRIFYGLRMSTKTFESHLKMLKAGNFTSVFLDDLYKNSTLPKKPVVITFDDGYLDNWTYAYPLLRKYGFKATIFVATDFVDPLERVRPNILDLWDGNIEDRDLLHQGFLSWKEMKEMEDEGFVDIQSHAKTHTWYFSGDEITDFLYPNSLHMKGYEWVLWNSKPELKPFYLNTNMEQYAEYGLPIYQHGKSLVTKRYFPNELMAKCLVEFVEKEGGEDFFQIKGWRRQLTGKVREIEDNANGGYFESEEEFCGRAHEELEESKMTIEKKLAKDVNCLCCPGGALNETILRIAKDVGYNAIIKSQRCIAESNELIERFSAPVVTVKDKNRIFDTIFLDGKFLNLAIKAYIGSTVSKWSQKLLFYTVKKFYELKASKKEYYYIRS